MKRTRNISLANLRKADKPLPLKPLTIGVMAATLSACGDSEVADIYASVMECAAENPDFVEVCEAAYEQALQEAEDTSPKYTRQGDCESDFGTQACVPHSSMGNNWFMPAMAGFMMARMFDSDFDLKKKRRKRYSSPLFMSKSRRSPVFGNWVSARGQSYGAFNTKRVKVSSKAFAPKPKVTKTIQRGGFGSMASKVASRSSWGG
ncbi:MAG: DUF1190 domain-containing protein [Gammaproteobacteria bacterium]|jgi:uncharacterized protein YgiB involved in biofilm formation|nr:DUF1190 domain-containing protein [Gammaproteobacteria bacterium]